MDFRMKTIAVLTMLAIASIGSSAAAQQQGWDPEGGDNWQAPPDQQQQQQQQQQPQQQQQWQQPQQQQPQQQQWQQQQQQQQQPQWGGDQEQPPAMGGDQGGDGASDHSTVVGHFGVAFHGVSQIPIGLLFDSSGMMLDLSVRAPIVGVRFWISESLGLDAGIGIGFINQRSESGDTIFNDASAVGFAAHAGLPVVFMHSQHYKFLLTPEVDIGFSDGELGNTLATGFLLSIGGRVGAEIHFGFIDVPNLALEGSIGAALNLRSTVLDIDPALPTVDESELALSTSVEEEPWDIFTGSIRAIYYFN